MKISFTSRKFAEAYEMPAVDDFIDRLEQAILRGDGSVPTEDVHAVVFAPVRFQAGYDMEEVDDFLDEVAIPLLEGRIAYDPEHDYSRQSRGGVPQQTEQDPEPRSGPRGGHPAERGGFFARLLGGGR
ncbi:DivIVA domain-containing protein [Brachybacterium sp. AOP3-A1-3]|uniref:DivIVA domain-containing protein n=1 Tax=Brachybacterium sp. AOP3-A1-3 TaxID=3457699 RepID=UPI004034F1DE